MRIKGSVNSLGLLLLACFLSSTAHAMTWEQWQAANFSAAELADSSVSGPEADPDGDGISNLLEFAFNLDPHQHDLPVVLPQTGWNGNHLTLSCRVRSDGEGLLYCLEGSNTLHGWARYNSIHVLSEEDHGSYLQQVWEDAVANTGGRHFLRLAAVLDETGCSNWPRKTSLRATRK